MPRVQKLGLRGLWRIVSWYVCTPMNPHFNNLLCSPILQEDNAAAKSDRENPKAKTEWQGVKAWVTDKKMPFDTLQALQLAGWLLFSMCFSFLSFCCLLLPFQYPERVVVPFLSLLASLLYAALALAFYFERL